MIKVTSEEVLGRNLNKVEDDPQVVQGLASAVMKIASRHGSQVRKLEISRVQLDCPKDFGEIVGHMPLLQVLEGQALTIAMPVRREPLGIEPIRLQSLKTVKVSNSNAIIFKYFAAPHVGSFQLLDSKSEFDYFLGLLKSDKLESLEIDSSARIFSSEFNISALKLKKLSIHSLDNEAETNLIKFLESQASTLIHLVLGKVACGPEVLETIFYKLERLERLNINFNTLPADKEFYVKLKTLTSLKELKSDSRSVSSTAFDGICERCPNLESLFVPNAWTTHNHLPSLAVSNPKLKVLSIDTMPNIANENMKFEFLRLFEVKKIIGLSIAGIFIANNPSIDTFHVNSLLSVSIPEAEVRALIGIPNLKHLKIGLNFYLARRIFDQVNLDSLGLKSLEMNVELNSKWTKLFFEFPDDVKNHQKIKCEYFESRTSTGKLRKRKRK